MYARAVGTRCVLVLEDFLPEFGDQGELRARITDYGWSILTVDPISVARSLISSARYRRGARMYEAPDTVDCSSLTKWVHAQLGIWIPRRSIQQSECGVNTSVTDHRPGDLIFNSGWRNYFRDDPDYGIGHVGILTGEGTVIEAANRRRGVVETPLVGWLGGSFRGIRRLLPVSAFWTISTRPKDEVESTNDLRWMLRIRSSSFEQGSQ